MSRKRIFLYIIICFLLLIAGYWLIKHIPPIIGFGPYDSDIHGARPTTTWDWLNLIIVPLFIAIAAWVLSSSGQSIERLTESERQKQETLEKYYERISNMLLEKKLNKSNRFTFARNIARSWTLSAFQRLDGSRKAEALHFLYRTNLIDKDPVINLNGSNLRNSNLRYAVLIDAEIKGAYFHGANLRGANLKGIDLTGSDLSHVDLRDSILTNANLSFTHLNKSKLQNLNLSSTDLKGADLRGARIWGIKIDNNQFDLIIITKFQRMIIRISSYRRKKH